MNKFKNLPYSSQLTKCKTIEERNIAFNKLPIADRRREVALDILLMIDSGKMIGAKGHYWSLDLHSFTIDKSNTSKELQDRVHRYINRKSSTCSVCAIGAATLTQIKLGNKLKPIWGTAKGKDQKYVFSSSTLSSMETRYEENVDDKKPWDDREVPYPVRSTEMLANIFLQVLKRGNFKPGDITDYLSKYIVQGTTFKQTKHRISL